MKQSHDIVFYTGTYTLTPDLWSTETTKDISKILNIKDIVDYHFVNFGNNGWAYRINYSAPELELRDKEFFDKGLQIFKDKAQAEVEYITLMNIKNSISEDIKDYL